MKKMLSSLPAVCLLVLSLSGCGYSFGSLAHPQLETIAVAPVINETVYYNASAVLRGVLAERITVDGSLKLKDARKADCIIYARIMEVLYTATDTKTLPDGTEAFLPHEWKCQVKVQYSLIIPGRAKPLIYNAQTTGSAMFTTGPDLEISRQNGMKMALFAAAKNVVSGVVEGW